MIEPSIIKVLADNKFCDLHGITRERHYGTKLQYRGEGDDSKIVYIKSPHDPEEKRLIALTDDEYETIEYV